MRAMSAVATATRTQNARHILYSVTARTQIGLFTLYCMGSMREHMISIGNGLDVHTCTLHVCVVWSVPRNVFSVKIELQLSLF